MDKLGYFCLPTRWESPCFRIGQNPTVHLLALLLAQQAYPSNNRKPNNRKDTSKNEVFIEQVWLSHLKPKPGYGVPFGFVKGTWYTAPVMPGIGLFRDFGSLLKPKVSLPLTSFKASGQISRLGPAEEILSNMSKGCPRATVIDHLPWQS